MNKSTGLTWREHYSYYYYFYIMVINLALQYKNTFNSYTLLGGLAQLRTTFCQIAIRTVPWIDWQVSINMHALIV